MIEHYLSRLWDSFAPAVANHLWQSTVVALAGALLTLALRKHHARARYWLWLAASLKFLVPFSMLVAFGRWLAWPRPAASDTQSYFVFQEIAQPFAPPVSAVANHPSATNAVSTWLHLLPILVVIWFAGFATFLLLWTVRWRRISAAMKAAEPLSQGREFSALRRVEALGGIRQPIPLLRSRSLLEPGIFGIAHPVLLWPEGISHRLDDGNLEAILAHEVWHVRRRDNLCALLHMLVESVFWFYPPVWWLGARLIDERERACDEEVLELGGDRQVYAESILKVCEFCLGSPLPCVSGVTGADLKKRMVHIMNDRILHNLGLGRKLLLTTAAALAIAIPVTVGLLTATPGRAQSQKENSDLQAPVYTSVSIKLAETVPNEPNRSKVMLKLADGSFTARSVTLQSLIQLAYRVQDTQISGGPDWVNAAKFDIDAKLDPSVIAPMQGSEQKGGDLKALLAHQFKLVVHSETRILPVYDLVVDSGGPRLQPIDGIHRFKIGPGELTGQGTHVELLAEQLALRLGRPVLDKTGLNGNYSFDLRWTPDPSEPERLKRSNQEPDRMPVPDANGPSLLTAVQEQLGLRLEPNTEPVQVLVIDHAESPSGIL